jgi:hypothetical protein
VTRADRTPPRDVFARVAVAGDDLPDGDTVRRCARTLAAAAGGAVVAAGPLSQCHVDALQRASLVVLPLRHERPSWGLTDSIAKALGSCERPVLFVPVA